MKNKIYLTVIIVASLLLFYIYDSYRFNDGKLHLVFCSVGQGDAIFVRTPGGVDILFDGGPDSSVLKCLTNHMPFFDRDLELVFLSHPHADHYAGLIEVLKSYSVLSFNTEKKVSNDPSYKQIQKEIMDYKVREKFIVAGNSYKTSDGVEIKTLWPAKEYISGLNYQDDLDKNSLSLIETLSYNNIKVLLTGDIQSDVLDKIYSLDNNFDIIEVSHHGSKTGTGKQTFDLIKPKYAVISVGRDNTYGLPASSVLSILKQKGIKTLRTDQMGDIEFVIDGNGKIEVR